MASKQLRLTSLEAVLMRRYPGVRVVVEWFEYPPDHYEGAKGHALWSVRFLAPYMEMLIKYGLATREQFEVDATLSYSKAYRHPCMRDSFGGRMAVAIWPHDDGSKTFEVCTLVDDYHNKEEVFTKKLQGEVARYLKPFTRGTRKPRQPA